ncbi:MAG: FtsQ-type POTRA domain-containing protein [Comamonadaceae bacterium]|nr:MAG: FtsQ-type POTRA domain-containing protein [Comamonadaceae bacterium]
MAERVSAPFDVRLMNVVATLLFALCLLMLLASGAWWVLRQPFFPLAGIRVDGEVVHSSESVLRANVAPQLAGNFFTVDLGRARAAFESVPWVRKAVVRREFPNRLRVTLTEQQPVAHWGSDAESRLVNNFGEVFEANTAEVEDELPRLVGPNDQASQVLGMYRTLAPMFEASELRLASLVLTGRGSWQAVLDSGASIELGRGSADDVAGRTERFLRTLTQVTSKYGRTVDALESADLRHRDAYALRMRGITTVATLDPKKK